LALEIAPWLEERGIHIIHQCGVAEEERVHHAYHLLNIDAEVVGFTTKIASLIEKSDFAVSRSGASTLWELCAAGVPAFFIPYPSAAGDHQYHNARYIIDHNAGWCERQEDGLAQKLKEAIMSDIMAKSEALESLIAPDGAVKIIKKIEEK
jgi:UDP-N-acetylglucosamine--N-acetylmuramyl-(pentapeptide) pyrophosphoryl-undecaprenol N-acetylglucosamine transferase